MTASPPRLPWPVIAVTVVTVTMCMLPGFLVSALAVQIDDDIGLEPWQLGLVVGTFMATAALVSAPSGRVNERIGWRMGLRSAALLSAAAQLAVAATARSSWLLLGPMALAGVGAAMASPAADLAIARVAPPERHGLMFGLKHAAIPGATLLGGLAVPAIALTAGWRWAFVAGAAVALVAAAATMVVPGDDTRVARGTAPPRPTTRTRHLVLLAVAVGLGIAATDSLATFFVAYAADTGIAPGTAGWLLAAGSASGMTTRIAAGSIIDRHRSADLAVVATMMLVGGTAIVAIAFGGAAGVVVGGVIGFTAGWGWSGLFTFAVVRANPEAPAAASGVTQAGKFLGGALGPLAFGFVADHVTFRAAWMMAATTLMLASGMIRYARNRHLPPVRAA